MTTSTVHSVNLLPSFLQTPKNSKFLASTIDQLIQPAQLERLDGFIGSTSTPTYNSTSDVYIGENFELRRNYQLNPALVTNDSLGNLQYAQSYDDLINEISINGGFVNNPDRLFRTDYYSFNPHVDWDKLVNYQNYYWLTNGPQTIEVTTENFNVDTNIIGKSTATVTVGTMTVALSNGMLITFGGVGTPDKYFGKEFFVEGVGNNIVLVDSIELYISANTATDYVNYADEYVDLFDHQPFDDYGFDQGQRISVDAEYITINRASRNLNPWSRYNRWVHHDVIRVSAEANNVVPVYPADKRARRPIIEFVADLKLFNFGSTAIETIDLVDTVTTDAFLTIEGSTSTGYTSGVFVDSVELEEGHRIIFTAEDDPAVNGKIYSVEFVNVGGYRTLTLVPSYDHNPVADSVAVVVNGTTYAGTSWWYDGSIWNFGQQKTKLNQTPLFDLYDQVGNSYYDKNYYLSNFTGNKIFSYKEGTGSVDPFLGFPLAYRNINAVGSWLFTNNLASDSLVISALNTSSVTISTDVAYCKISKLTGDVFENSWASGVEYPMPLLDVSLNDYREPLSLTNNPLNEVVDEFTISELVEHVQTISSRIPGYQLSTTKKGNLRDLVTAPEYGSGLISSINPISFAQMFIGKKEHNLVNAITKVSYQYDQFKLTLLNSMIGLPNQYQKDPVGALDYILTQINQTKGEQSPYYLSDMVGYGQDKIVRTWTVTNTQNTVYPLALDFDLDRLGLRSVLIYHNGIQLVHGTDYVFDRSLSSVEILKALVVKDTLVAVDYINTEGAYIPPTPTKLGLYPKFIPSKYQDNTYITPSTVIQGHDGSIMLAYNDFRDDIILELEKRIYNNIKSTYRPELFDVAGIIPGAFRTTDYSLTEVNEILQKEFVRWAGQYGIDYTVNEYYESSTPRTWNYYNSSIANATNVLTTGTNVSGSWRGVFEYFYDTDRPHTHPWEMLGFSKMPSWWTTEYGSAPYISTNNKLWNDLKNGYIRGTNTTSTFYARPGLSSILPVDGSGNLLDPTVYLLSQSSIRNKDKAWIAGDQGQAETAWRRSSNYPFAIQKLAALTKPASYASLMYDPSRISKNISDQWTYGVNQTLLRLPDVEIFEQNGTLTDGYSVWVSEVGQQRTSNYLAELQNDLDYVDYRLFYKVGGFVDQNTLQVIIDAYEPTTNSPGAVLPQENYKLKLNVSNPIKSVSISGLIIQKSNGNFVVKGYDTRDPYFTYYKSIRNTNTRTINVGGVSESYVKWESSGTGGNTNLNAADITTANSAVAGNFYQKGQLVKYEDSFYRTTVSHRAGATFNSAYFASISSLPTTGGITVQLANRFEVQSTQVSYGTEFSSIQEVYDLIIGYGRWLEDQGFIFDEYNRDLNTVIDWELTAREFLYWTSQKWKDGSLIVLSPFADQLKYKFSQSVVDNIFNDFYQYGILKADGSPYPQKSISVTRYDGLCTISTLPDTDGIYFARLNCVQKEHAMIFDNSTIFGDVIYNKRTGSRQRRMKLVGFRTANWDGDYFSPGFLYDAANITPWSTNTRYLAGSVVSYNGNYYTAIGNIDASQTFDIKLWNLLSKKPEPGLLPNFDYKIKQFEDFYSLDIDNFDIGQEMMAQHLTGYTPRVYLNNIFTDPIAQYKFYQGYIREKGTQNAITKLSKASIQNLKGEVSYKEDWAFRLGHYGAYQTYQEIEVPLIEETFLENPQIISFVDSLPTDYRNKSIHYSLPEDLQISPDNYITSNSFITTSSQDIFVLTHSGYVRLDDVTATAYNENSLLDIANNSSLKDGDTVWLGFKQNGDWDVYRHTYLHAGIIGVYVSAPATSITFTTSGTHGLSIGELISVSKFDDQVNGIYFVQDIPRADQFTVASTLSSIQDSTLLAPGQLYVFRSARVAQFDQVPSDVNLLSLPYGAKFWIDNNQDADQNWSVFEKINNYTSTATYSSSLISGQGLGASISKRYSNDIVVAGAPDYYQSGQYGAVFVYKKSGNYLENILKYRLDQTGLTTDFGNVVVYDDIKFHTSRYGLIFAGAPGAFFNRGMVKVSAIDSVIVSEGTSTYIRSQNSAIKNFGASIYVQRSTSTKLVLVGAPDTYTSTTTGAVYSYTVTDPHNGTIQTHFNSTLTCYANKVGSEWGYSISGAEDASYIAVGAPGYSTGTGLVSIFTGTAVLHSQTIISPTSINSRFGETLSMSKDGSYLFVGAPDLENSNGSHGKVYVYSNTNGIYILDQTIENPVPLRDGQGMKFGKAISINSLTNTVVISSLGVNNTFKTTFDGGTATFDNEATDFLGKEEYSGAVYQYYKKDRRFVLAQELSDTTVAINSGTDYGNSIIIDDDVILVGAPARNNPTIGSGVYQFNKIDTSKNSWDQIRTFENLVSVNTIKKVSLIDTLNDDVVQYLDVYDPLKGKIPGVAEQEITYKLVSDPAVYSIGNAGVNIDTNTNWLDTHVGELWWDLSTAKYVWYEQGNLEYRRNNWGKLFPGSTIDVYEWIGTTYLPTEWSSLADTPKGLTEGVSGQPKFVDNTVISVKQVYDNITNSFSNVYYYWVKNKITIPNSKNRRISGYEVANAIADPTSYGLEFANFMSAYAVSLSNVSKYLIDNRISLNVAQDILTDQDSSLRHTEWILLQENSENSKPPALLEKKMIDSIVGHDILGNNVPNSNLTARTRYGIGIRPQQTIFKDRLAALRNIVEFANDVLIKEQVTGRYNFDNLNAMEQIPSIYSGTYDQLAEDNYELNDITTSSFRLASIQCQVDSNGHVSGISVINSGQGYGTSTPVYNIYGEMVGYQGPTFQGYPESGNGFVIKTVVSNTGSIITTATTIISSGTGYLSNFTITARPQTVVVQADETYNGGWAEYQFNYSTYKWDRYRTQDYNTTLYWKYVDWADQTYNVYKDYTTTVADTYELAELTLSPGQYIKVNNVGDGRYIIVESITTGTQGTFGLGYNLVYSQNGTIQILDSIWDRANSRYGWDYLNTYDETHWDQVPDKELVYILNALKEDLFINDLKINWNLLFFKAVKYALTEQKLLDWAFKTSFISVTNNAGILGQPSVYKLQDSTYYEDYINEIKPYHTKIRNFTTKHSVVDPTNTTVTDFDHPVYYNTTAGIFVVPTVSNSEVLNNPVRQIDTTLKFDRISKGNQIGSSTAFDTFICNGVDTEFVLNWVARADKSKITIKLDGILLLNSEYTVEYYNSMYNNYNKEYSKIKLLKTTPSTSSVVTVSYAKSVELLTAVERIQNYYAPTAGMLGTDTAQLMTGIEYPGVTVGGLDFTGKNNGYNPDTYFNTSTNGIDYNFTNTTISGIRPEDLTLDGELGFVTPSTGYAPEEVVPGHVTDALGINVYTKTANGAPIVLNGYQQVLYSTSTQAFPIAELPTTVRNIQVILNGIEMIYVSSTSSLTTNTFTIDWDETKIIIPPYVDGTLGYSIVGVSGGTGTTPGVIDKGVTIAVDNTTGTVSSLAGFSSVKSVFVTVNGVPVSQVNTVTNYGYMLLPYGAEMNRASVTVYNLPAGTNTIQAWFFADEDAAEFNTIHEQTFVITGTQVLVENLSGNNYAVALGTLNYPTGDIEPLSAQTIVEITDQYGTRRLLPPDVNYYSVIDSNNTTFPIRVTPTANNPIPEQSINLNNVKVYRNGIALRPGFDYTVLGTTTATVFINTSSITLARGDAIAVEAMIPGILGTTNSTQIGSGATGYNYQYRIDGNTLYIAPGIQDDNPGASGYATLTTATIKVTSYSDVDGMLIETQKFSGNINRRFQVSRPIINDNYAWVTLFKWTGDYFRTHALMNGIDFMVMDDNVTIQVSDNWILESTDIVEVMTVSSQQFSSTVLGYRQFTDVLGKTSFTRLSKKYSTYLTQPLKFSDTEIYVDDPTVLSPPINAQNIPGVILVDGERIEFFRMDGNVLSKLRRSSLGTGPSEYLEEGTKVIDQGTYQGIPYSENVRIQNTYTKASTNVYSISPATVVGWVNTITSATVRCDGIMLSTATIIPPVELFAANGITNVIRAVDQVDVYYGGRKLSKAGRYVHDTTSSYDSIPLTSIIGSTSTVSSLPNTPNIGTAYLVTATNKVWVYTGSRTENTSTKGYVYSGLTYIPADFVINTATQTLILNTSTVNIEGNKLITIVKKDVAVKDSWNDVVSTNTTVSLLYSTGTIARFLQDAPAELPGSNYYGGALELTDEGGDPLTDDNDQDLQGYY